MIRNVWFTSDTLAYDAAMCCAGKKSLPPPRGGFDSVEQMNQALVDGINRNVARGDILYHLGNWSHGSFDNIAEFRRRLNVEDVRLVLGKRDTAIAVNRSVLVGRTAVNAHSLFTSVKYFDLAVFFKRAFVLFHYPLRLWPNQSNKRVLHLHGHTLGDPDQASWGRSMDVGVDNAYRLLGEYRPFHIDEIVKMIGGEK